MEQVFHQTGYFFIFLSTILWVISLIPRSLKKINFLIFLKTHWHALLLSFVFTFIMNLNYPPQFRILADETNLASIASSMYLNKDFYISLSGFNTYETYNNIHHVWGTRPLFFPFLISISHSLMGYNVENIFLFNFLFGFCSLFLIYFIIQLWLPYCFGLIGLILLASYPIFAISVTSAGFEILNLFFALLAYYFLYIYLNKKRAIDLERLSLTLILLANIRYESIIFTICFIFIFIYLYIRYSRFKIITFTTSLIPLLFLPIFWQRIITMKSSRLMGVTDEREVFNIAEIGNRSVEFFYFFLSNSHSNSTIPVLFLLGILGACYGMWALLKKNHELNYLTNSLLIYAFLSFTILYFITNTYNQPQGGISHPTSIRLGIIFLPYIIISVTFFLFYLSNKWRFLKKYLIIISFSIFVWYAPTVANNASVNTLVVSREYKSILKYINSNYNDKNIIIISERPGLYTVHHWGSVNFNYANNNVNKLLDRLNKKISQEIIVIQRIRYDNYKPELNNFLSKEIKLEQLYEEQFAGNFFTRISRVIY